MKRFLMASTAVVALLATSALAQDTSSSSSMMSSSEMSSSEPVSSMEPPMDSSMMSSEPMSAEPSAEMTDPMAPNARVPVDMLAGYTVVDSDMLVTRIIGMPVYNGTGDDAQQVGTINDLILNQNGEVAAVVLGVGGFLGLGEKQVAVDFGALEFVLAADNTERYVVATTVDELTQAPDFQVVDDTPADGAPMDDATTSSSVPQ